MRAPPLFPAEAAVVLVVITLLAGAVAWGLFIHATLPGVLP